MNQSHFQEVYDSLTVKCLNENVIQLLLPYDSNEFVIPRRLG